MRVICDTQVVERLKGKGYGPCPFQIILDIGKIKSRENWLGLPIWAQGHLTDGHLTDGTFDR